MSMKITQNPHETTKLQSVINTLESTRFLQRSLWRMTPGFQIFYQFHGQLTRLVSNHHLHAWIMEHIPAVGEDHRAS